MEALLETAAFKSQALALAEVVRFLAQRGWTPATSSNFSVRLTEHPQYFAISKSGKDKYAFSGEDVMIVDAQGLAVAPKDARPSAETLLHTLLYERDEIGAVLHTHSVASTVLTQRSRAASLQIEGFELLKGLQGNTSHELREVVPIFANDQDMVRLAAEVKAYWAEHPAIHGFLIQGHGLYTWGRDLAEARRHIETFEFLFECLMHMEGKAHGHS